MDLGLRGKSVIVTGGASNIGRSITFAFAKEGSSVVIADIDAEQAEKTLREAKELGGRAAFVQTDVTNLESVEEMVQRVIGMNGGIQVLVNDVGWAKPAPFLDFEYGLWEKVIAVNFTGALHCMRAALPHMIERKGGSIVSIASDAARDGEYNEAVYSGAKAGVIGATKAIAREVGKHGVRLNVVCPGMTVPMSSDVIGKHSLWYRGAGAGGVGDEITPERMEKAKKAYALRRLGTTQDIANAVLFLASDAASFITGQTLSVSGGYSKH